MMMDIKDITNAPTEMLDLLRRIANACETIANSTVQIQARTEETVTGVDNTALACETIATQTQAILNTQSQVLKRLQSGIPVVVQTEEHVG